MKTTPTGRLKFRELTRAEIDGIWMIDRREHIARMYRLADGELQLEAHEVDVPGWAPRIPSRG